MRLISITAESLRSPAKSIRVVHVATQPPSFALAPSAHSRSVPIRADLPRPRSRLRDADAPLPRRDARQEPIFTQIRLNLLAKLHFARTVRSSRPACPQSYARTFGSNVLRDHKRPGPGRMPRGRTPRRTMQRRRLAAGRFSLAAGGMCRQPWAMMRWESILCQLQRRNVKTSGHFRHHGRIPTRGRRPGNSKPAWDWPCRKRSVAAPEFDASQKRNKSGTCRMPISCGGRRRQLPRRSP